ncbi:MAG: hypothetical protein KFB93_07260 [Simkaniaceae bacterium]|nr:MAG: hypothetical protein KFB93_07260 [Simkaniaceae bacterium]
MKLFSLISSTAIITVLPISSFCNSKMADLEGRVSGLEKTHTNSVDNPIEHQPNSNNYNGGYQSSKPSDSNAEYTGAGTDMHPKTVLDSARGCRNRNMPYFDLELLYLRAIEDSLSYAWDVHESGGDRVIYPKDQDFQFKPGFRVGLGYNFGYDDWDLRFGYTWHYTKVHTSVQGTTVFNNGSTNGTIIGTLAILPLNDGSPVFVAYERGKSHWQNQFNVWDLDLGRNFYVGKHLAVKPILGLKGALIRQHLQAFMYNADRGETGQQGQADLQVPFENALTRFKSRFWGIGPKLGASGEWELGAGFSLFGSIHSAMLYGQFKTKNFITARVVADRVDPDSDRVGNNEGGRIFDDFYRLRTMAYASLGIEWSRCFWDWMNFQMHIGWEGQYWWQQMEFLNFKDLTPDGDLTLTGVNAGFRFDF